MTKPTVSAYAAKLKAMRESLEESKTTFENMTGVIRSIDIMTAGDVYGDKAKAPDREVLQCLISVDGTADMFKAAFTMPTSAISWKNEEFKLGKFLVKYGDLPEVGTKVSIIMTRGFYDLEL